MIAVITMMRQSILSPQLAMRPGNVVSTIKPPQFAALVAVRVTPGFLRAF